MRATYCALDATRFRRSPSFAIFPIFISLAGNSSNIWELHLHNLSKNTDRQNEKRQYQTEISEWYCLLAYDARSPIWFSMLSINIPYPVVGSLMRTCVTAPTSLPFWMMGSPTRVWSSRDNKFYEKIFLSCLIFSSLGTENIFTFLPIAAYLCSPIAW